MLFIMHILFTKCYRLKYSQLILNNIKYWTTIILNTNFFTIIKFMRLQDKYQLYIIVNFLKFSVIWKKMLISTKENYIFMSYHRLSKIKIRYIGIPPITNTVLQNHQQAYTCYCGCYRKTTTRHNKSNHRNMYWQTLNHRVI